MTTHYRHWLDTLLYKDTPGLITIPNCIATVVWIFRLGFLQPFCFIYSNLPMRREAIPTQVYIWLATGKVQNGLLLFFVWICLVLYGTCIRRRCFWLFCFLFSLYGGEGGRNIGITPPTYRWVALIILMVRDRWIKDNISWEDDWEFSKIGCLYEDS